MIKKLLIGLLCFAMVAMISGRRVRTGSIFTDISYTSGVKNDTGTNTFVGYISPKSAVTSVDIVVSPGFNSDTNNFINVFTVWQEITNSVSYTKTNTIVNNHNVNSSNNAISAHVVLSNSYIIMSSNTSTAVWCNYEQSGNTAATAGAARVILNYIQF